MMNVLTIVNLPSKPEDLSGQISRFILPSYTLFSERRTGVKGKLSFFIGSQIIARAYERMGNAFVKAGQLQDAIKAYSDSLVENRCYPALIIKLGGT